MKIVCDYMNPKTGLVERVEMKRNKWGEYVFHDLSLPSAVRKKAARQKRTKDDVEAAAWATSGRYAGRCVRPGVKGSVPSEFCALRVEW